MRTCSTFQNPLHPLAYSAPLNSHQSYMYFHSNTELFSKSGWRHLGWCKADSILPVQEESEQVAMGGRSAIGTRDAIAGLAKLAAARGARVGIVLTWAWLDGKNDKFPSFEAMQVCLSSYRALFSITDTPLPSLLAFTNHRSMLMPGKPNISETAVQLALEDIYSAQSSWYLHVPAGQGEWRVCRLGGPSAEGHRHPSVPGAHWLGMAGSAQHPF